MILAKNQLRKGMKVRTIWKGKVYEGIILNEPKRDAQENAKITKGRFIAIRIYNEKENKILLMPYTSKTTYELLN